MLRLRHVVRQEHETCAVLAERRQLERDHRTQEAVRDLDENARAVAGVRLTAACSPMLQVDEDLERLHDDVVGLLPLGVDDETDTAGVVLIAGGVESPAVLSTRCHARSLQSALKQKRPAPLGAGRGSTLTARYTTRSLPLGEMSGSTESTVSATCGACTATLNPSLTVLVRTYDYALCVDKYTRPFRKPVKGTRDSLARPLGG